MAPDLVYSLRLPEEAIGRLRERARAEGARPTALIRDWVLEGLDSEPGRAPGASEPSVAYGASRVARLVTDRLDEIADACRARGVSRLAVFGSAAGGRFDPARSDVDLAVSFQPMPPPVRAACFLGLAEDLERILARPVDLVEESAVRNPYVRRSMANTAVVVYGPA